MAEVDMAVRRDGRTLRLVTNGERAALFGKGGTVERLVVTSPATAPMRMPELADENGAAVKLARGSKPCSCTGAPWSTSVTDLRGQVLA